MKKYSLVKICLLALCSAMFLGVLTPTASAATFTDVSAHWAASYIETCANLGIVDGVGGGRFEPEGKVTNAQFVRMLCAAFFSSDEQTFENENRAAINAYFGGSIQWYSYQSYYFQALGLLNSVDYNIRSAASANQPMNRNNMAQVAANVLAQKGIAADKGDKALAQANLSLVNDYYTIPENNRDAVKTCYALGIINGTDGGKFNGENTMTRAQACTVITRLLDVVKTGPVTTTPFDPIETPKPTPSVPMDIKVTSSPSGTNTIWSVTDNGFTAGYLNNGKEITPENVQELLTKAEAIWADGMTWTVRGTENNNSYVQSSTTMTQLLTTKHGISVNYACGGFAAMLSDYIFGKTNTDWHVVTNFADIRPGDIIYSNTLDHVMIVSDKVKTGSRAGAVYVAHGNYGNQVRWGSGNAWNAFLASDLGTYTAYSRYPD